MLRSLGKCVLRVDAGRGKTDTDGTTGAHKSASGGLRTRDGLLLLLQLLCMCQTCITVSKSLKAPAIGCRPGAAGCNYEIR